MHSAGVAQAAAPSASETAPDAAHTRIIKRDPRFAELTAADVDHFRSIVGAEGLVQDETELQQYNNDWMNKFRQSASLC